MHQILFSINLLFHVLQSLHCLVLLSGIHPEQAQKYLQSFFWPVKEHQRCFFSVNIQHLKKQLHESFCMDFSQTHVFVNAPRVLICLIVLEEYNLFDGMVIWGQQGIGTYIEWEVVSCCFAPNNYCQQLPILICMLMRCSQ